MEKTIERIPAYALSYLVNGDATSLTEEEIKEIDALCHKDKIELVCPITDSVEGGTQPYFSNHPYFGKPTLVEDCIVIYNW